SADQPVAAPPATTAPPAPGPVSTQAALTGTCQMGYELAPPNPGSGAWGPFQPGIPPAGEATANSGAAIAYKLTLTNSGSRTADVSAFVVAFYDASGRELGSDSASAGDTFITAGQSLYWLEVSGTTMDDYGDRITNGSQDDGIPYSGTAATCTLVQWG